MNNQEEQAKHSAELLIARATAHAAGIDKSKELDNLIAQYGGKDNVPHEKLVDYLGPMDEIAKSIRLTSALQQASEFFGLDFMETKVAGLLGLFINARLENLEAYNAVKKLHDGPSDEVRPGIVQLMLRMEDISQGNINALTRTPKSRATWTRWLDGQPFETTTGPSKETP